MRFWRICRLRYTAQAATGEGARLYGGRWNSRGVRVVYASATLALAAIETFVNLEPNLRPADLVSIEGEIPAGIETLTLDVKSLAARWHQTRDESLHRFNSTFQSPRTAAEGTSSAALCPARIHSLPNR